MTKLQRARGRQLSALEASIATSPSLARRLPGALALFAVGVPLGVIALWLAERVLPVAPRAGYSFDLLGALLNAVASRLIIRAPGRRSSAAAPK